MNNPYESDQSLIKDDRMREERNYYRHKYISAQIKVHDLESELKKWKHWWEVEGKSMYHDYINSGKFVGKLLNELKK